MGGSTIVAASAQRKNALAKSVRAEKPAGARKSKKAAAGLSPLSTRDRILREAERIFADAGFEGASLRKIALAANVPLALLTYYFNSKIGLYRAVFERRTPIVVQQRFAGLEIADLESDPDRRLQLIVEALIVPMLQLRKTEDGGNFGRLLAYEESAPASNTRGVISEFFDPVGRRMIESLSKAMPGRSKKEINWIYHFMLGAMVHVMADSGRMERLSHGQCNPRKTTVSIKYLTSYLRRALQGGPLVGG
jgi:AcrR family transcriptional regulator